MIFTLICCVKYLVFMVRQGWGLCMLEPQNHPSDFNALHVFLSPNGYLFKVIDKLMLEHDAMFQFPCSSLSVS